MTLPFRKFILATEGKTRPAFLSKRSENRSCSESSEGLAGWTKIVKTGRKTERDELELLFENRTDRTHGVNTFHWRRELREKKPRVLLPGFLILSLFQLLTDEGS